MSAVSLARTGGRAGGRAGAGRAQARAGMARADAGGRRRGRGRARARARARVGRPALVGARAGGPPPLAVFFKFEPISVSQSACSWINLRLCFRV